MESKKIYSSAYAKKLAKGLFAVNIFLPIEKREELEEKARSESLPLTVYLRGLICGKEYRLISQFRNEKYTGNIDQ